MLELTRQYLLRVRPAAGRRLDSWWLPRAERIPDPALRAHALDAMTSKRFHCQGGAAYAVNTPHAGRVLAAIISLQTISDYLDTLCDRGESADGADYRRLHRAMLDAVDTDALRGGYYDLHPSGDDGGYLAALVRQTRLALGHLPGYQAVAPSVMTLVERYNDLQEFKHLRPRPIGEAAMERWYAQHRRPGFAWWEYAAACGSTLGMFALFRLAARGAPTREEIDALLGAYVPAMCGLHILLDYFIDQAEDLQAGEINLVSYYHSPAEQRDRLLWFAATARECAAILPEPGFHRWVADGLPGLYLADPKARGPLTAETARALLQAGSPVTRFVHWFIRARFAYRAVRPRLHAH